MIFKNKNSTKKKPLSLLSLFQTIEKQILVIPFHTYLILGVLRVYSNHFNGRLGVILGILHIPNKI